MCQSRPCAVPVTAMCCTAHAQLMHCSCTLLASELCQQLFVVKHYPRFFHAFPLHTHQLVGVLFRRRGATPADSALCVPCKWQDATSAECTPMYLLRA